MGLLLSASVYTYFTILSLFLSVQKTWHNQFEVFRFFKNIPSTCNVGFWVKVEIVLNLLWVDIIISNASEVIQKERLGTGLVCFYRP